MRKKWLLTKCRMIQQINPQRADQLLNGILKISESIHYKLGIATYNGFKSVQYVNQMQLDDVKLTNDKALEYLTGDRSVVAKNQLAVLHNTYGIIYQQREMYDSEAFMYLCEAL